MGNEAIAIRPAEADERGVVADLWRASNLTRPWNDPESDFDLAIGHANARVLVARSSDTLVGAVMTGHDGHRGALYYLGVDPRWRRRGIGVALVRAAEDWCRGEGVPKLNLLVRRENAGVVAFYAALGYRENDSVSLYRNTDPERAEREARQKADWTAKLVGG
jgi:ribosomal protein S18 acetylase RimI-like enzyme